MALASGTRFGTYEIGEAIGAGGMGEIYRAHDTTLERDVAIKVLPTSFVDDQGRVERFEREAKTLASLNHPNIAQIHGLEKSDGTTAIVMELIEGPTLADRIAEGRLSADEALNIALQIADALEAAHGQGIVHRDLKPANVKLRPDGTVKVLDFGIAKAFDIKATSGPGAPALTTPAMTQTGIILGTAAYMSPEQARGKPVDDRTDVWAFGCLLYEMLTGQPAFAGEDVALTLARILANDTDMKSLPAAITPAVRQTIELCLRKDPRKRIADIRDVKLALEGAFDTLTPQGGTQLVERKPGWRRALPFVTPLIAALMAASAAWVWLRSDPPPVTRFEYFIPENHSFQATEFRVLAVAPDGRSFVYNTQGGLQLRRLDELDARLVQGTDAEPNILPIFSPDGTAVAYRTPLGELKRIGINGGAPVTLADGFNLGGGMSWTSDGNILLSQEDGLYRMSARGGELELLLPNDNDLWLQGPRLLPDGDTVIYTEYTPGNAVSATIVARSISTGERTVLVGGGSDGHYVAGGYLVFAIGNGLFAVPFDPETLAVSGGAVSVVQDVVRDAFAGGVNFDISSTGTLIYQQGLSAGAASNNILWVDRQGRERMVDAPARAYTYPRISPDGTKVAFDTRDQEFDIWIWDLTREALTRLTFDPGQDEFPVWSPDGRQIAFSSTRVSSSAFETGLFTQAADGTGVVTAVANEPGQMFPAAYVRDGTRLIYSGAAETNINDDISVVDLQTGETIPLLNSMFSETNPELSPDGEWLAYTSNESGQSEVYVRPFPDVNAGRWQVSTAGGIQPLWAPDGSEIFYRSGTAVIAVSVQTDPSFSAGTPLQLFEGDYIIGPGGRNYDVAPDGNEFLMIRSSQESTLRPRIVVVENWIEELKRLVPTE